MDILTMMREVYHFVFTARFHRSGSIHVDLSNRGVNKPEQVAVFLRYLANHGFVHTSSTEEEETYYSKGDLIITIPW